MKNQKLKSIPPLLTFLFSTSLSHANLIAYWPFEDGEGTVVKDVVGGFDGTMSDGTWVTPGKVGAWALEGFGDQEIICDPAAISSTEDLTLAWWMIDNQASWGTIMDKSVTGSGYGFDILVRPESTEDSPLRFRIGGWQSYGGWGAECRLPVGAYKDGEWVHIVCTYDRASDTARIYVNGQLPENGSFNPKTGIVGEGGYCEGVNNVDVPLYLRGGWETFDGVLDEVAMWDRALTPEEVALVYTNGPLSVEQKAQALAISSFDYASENQEITLTWASNEGETYLVSYSSDLLNWTSVLADGIQADAGESTSKTYPLAALGTFETLYFRVEKVE